MTPTLEELLDFAATHPAIDDKAQAEIRTIFEISPARYLQLLNEAITTHEQDALQHDPVTTRRLQRLTTTRTARRERRARHHGTFDHHD